MQVPGEVPIGAASFREAGASYDREGADGGQRQAELRPDPGVQDRGHQHHLPQYSRPQEPLLPVSTSLCVLWLHDVDQLIIILSGCSSYFSHA